MGTEQNGYHEKPVANSDGEKKEEEEKKEKKEEDAPMVGVLEVVSFTNCCSSI